MSRAPRRLTVVASDVAPIGGMERVAYELCRRLRDRGWELTVIARTCTLPPGPGLRFHRILAPPRPVPLALALSWVHGSLLLWRHRRGLVQTNNPVVANRVDVVHVHFSEAGYRARGGGSRSSRGTLAYRLNSRIAAALELAAERWSYRSGRVRRLTCVSAGVADDVRRHFPPVARDARVIPNGVDRERFGPGGSGAEEERERLGVPAGVPVALFVGGDWQRKGLRHAIEAVARSPAWHLVVVGPGDAEGFGRDAVTAGAGGRVHFAGRRDDVRPAYALSQALLLPTAYEAFSLVTLEAAASGLVLLVPPVNGAAELVRDGVNGWLIERDGTAIAARLDELAARPELVRSMSAAAVASAATFDWEAITTAYEALYAELGG